MHEKTARVLITGAAGNLGSKLRQHLEGTGRCTLTLMDLRPGEDSAIIQADLSVYDTSWVRHFFGQDVIVHLAANPWQSATWDQLQGPNVDGLIHVFEAAVAGGVGRVIYASSSSVMRGHVDANVPLTPDMAMRPTNNYQAAKAFGERLGRSYSERHGLSVICMRIGVVRHGENLPKGSYFEQRYWLSNRDFCQAMEQAIFVPNIRCATLFLASNNSNPLFDLGETHRILGYCPEDIHHPVRPPIAERIYCLARNQAHRVIRVLRRILKPT